MIERLDNTGSLRHLVPYRTPSNPRQQKCATPSIPEEPTRSRGNSCAILPLAPPLLVGGRGAVFGADPPRGNEWTHQVDNRSTGRPEQPMPLDAPSGKHPTSVTIGTREASQPDFFTRFSTRPSHRMLPVHLTAGCLCVALAAPHLPDGPSPSVQMGTLLRVGDPTHLIRFRVLPAPNECVARIHFARSVAFSRDQPEGTSCTCPLQLRGDRTLQRQEVRSPCLSHANHDAAGVSGQTTDNRLCALAPPPYYPLTRYHTVIAPRARLRNAFLPLPPRDVRQCCSTNRGNVAADESKVPARSCDPIRLRTAGDVQLANAATWLAPELAPTTGHSTRCLACAFARWRRRS